MKKKEMSNLQKIQRIAKKFPKTINEAIQFEGGDMENDEYDDMDLTEPEDDMEQSKPSEPEVMDVAKFVDDIRKQSLKGMAQLSDNPDDEQYQLLKKIWQICDKKPEQQNQKQNEINKPNNF